MVLVAERVYYAEHEGSKAELILGYVERSRAFREAVLAGDAERDRAAMMGFFRSHLHVVRVRVMRAGRLLVDVGGPYVLAPIQGVIRDSRGRVARGALRAGGRGRPRLHDPCARSRARNVAEAQGSGHPAPGPRERTESRPGSPTATKRTGVLVDAEAFQSGTLHISLLYPIT